MTTIPTSVADAQEQILEGIRESQNTMLEAMRAWAEAAQKAAAAAPAPESVVAPDPREAVANAFGFAEQLLATQRDFAHELVSVLTPSPTQTPAPAPEHQE